MYQNTVEVETITSQGAISDKTYNKLYWRLLPFLALCYMFAYIDRINMGFAKLQMQDAINLSDAAYGLGAGIFFLGYVLFEIPSNLYLTKIGAKRTFVRIMILWGLTSASMMFVSSPTMFYILRFLLGVFEAGFFPGVIFYLTLWFPVQRMASAMALLMLAAPIGSIICGPLSTWLMTHFHGVNGLQGWQWMFMLEGLPCVLLGIWAWFYIIDKPEQASWLTKEEKQELASSISQKQQSVINHASFLTAIKTPLTYALAILYFCIMCGIYAISFWLPTILQSHGITDLIDIGLYSALPYIAALFSMVILSKSSDIRQERRLHVAIPALVAGLALFASNYMSNFFLAILLLIIATALVWTAYTIFWSIPSKYMQGTAAAGGIAMINTIGLFGGFLSPYVLGWIKQTTGSLTYGLILMTVLLLIASVIMFSQRKV
ncbi:MULTISPECIES: MFS transporter [Providencia]|uniref:MFS transporter n=2 Tax=Providencia TaxID=586 RepID=A0AAI9D8K8_PROST|nr:MULTISPECIES: MFS transporter [Providencia]ELR5039722.1 MFS transporter [Providencia stuartii]ELR5080452.1 MFS transporter [Providencia stuartii]ELR5111211.1 MFS transporter [Providencia stuartii]MDX4944392.1 MFS transporter [Providencia manganoxydans]QQO60700.1 MFS transporter [Providencia manganoxydans]